MELGRGTNGPTNPIFVAPSPPVVLFQDLNSSYQSSNSILSIPTVGKDGGLSGGSYVGIDRETASTGGVEGFMDSRGVAATVQVVGLDEVDTVAIFNEHIEEGEPLYFADSFSLGFKDASEIPKKYGEFTNCNVNDNKCAAQLTRKQRMGSKPTSSKGGAVQTLAQPRMIFTFPSTYRS